MKNFYIMKKLSPSLRGSLFAVEMQTEKIYGNNCQRRNIYDLTNVTTP